MNLSHIPSLRFALALPTTLLMYLFLASCSTEGDESGDNKARHAARRIAGQKQSYSTNFLAIENPISEGGKWINGGTTGRDRGNVQAIPGLAFGTTVCPAHLPTTTQLRC